MKFPFLIPPSADSPNVKSNRVLTLNVTQRQLLHKYNIVQACFSVKNFDLVFKLFTQPQF